jgi:hypothetical protein
MLVNASSSPSANVFIVCTLTSCTVLPHLPDIALAATLISDFDNYHTVWESSAPLDKFLLPIPLVTHHKKPIVEFGGAIDVLITKAGEKISGPGPHRLF